MKSDRAEGISILEVVKKLALSHPEISFRLYEIKDAGNPREILRLEKSTGSYGLSKRIQEVLKNSFMDNSQQVEYESEGVKVAGYIGSPTFISGKSSGC